MRSAPAHHYHSLATGPKFGVHLNQSQRAIGCMLVINRLVKPMSEHAFLDWTGRTILPEILGQRLTPTVKDRIDRAGDLLYKHRTAIQEGLRDKEASLFQLRRRIILYDVTNTHFEGVCASNPKARHGKNKQQRNDCRQIAIGMAFDEFGFPLTHDVFAGNISDTKTLEGILDKLGSSQDQRLRPIVVLDAGFASKDNLAMLRKRGFGYLVNMTRTTRARWTDEFASGGFTVVAGREGLPPVEVKTVPDPDLPDGASGVLVLCRSGARREKETAMLTNAETRFLADLTALRARVTKGRLKEPAKIERAIGRLLKKHPRVARFYQIELVDHTLRTERIEDTWQAHLARCGDYILKTDQQLPAGEIWSLYMTLLQAEEGFACLKGSLGPRPNFHQLEHRVEAHVFLTLLAYHLLAWIRQKLRASGERRDWATLREVLSTHMVQTTVLPQLGGRQTRVRKPSLPDAEQVRIYELLGIDWKSWYRPQKKTLHFP